MVKNINDFDFDDEFDGGSSSKINYGIIALVVFVLSAGAGWYGWENIVNSIAGAFSALAQAPESGKATGNMMLGIILLVVAAIGLPTSLVLAGAGIAKKKGQILGIVVYALSVAPVVYWIISFAVTFGNISKAGIPGLG